MRPIGFRRTGAALLTAALVTLAFGARRHPLEAAGQAAAPGADVAYATIAELQQRIASGQETSHSLVQKLLDRIDALDRNGPALHAVLEVNPDALQIADQLDAERKSRGPRGPLHGIPILIKDNIATADRMQTTAGSLALVGSKPPKDAFIVAALREGGRRHPRQDEPERVGQLPVHALVERLERPRRPDEESVRARSQSVRLELGLRRRRSRRLLGGRHRHGNRRLDRLAVEQQLSRRHQADRRPAEPRGHRADLAHPGHRGPDGAHRRRRGRRPRRDDRRRPRRRGDESECGQVARRLHEVPGSGRAEGRADRRRAQAAVRLQPGRRPDRGDGHRRHESARRGHRRSGEHPDARQVRRRRVRRAALRVQGRPRTSISRGSVRRRRCTR